MWETEHSVEANVAPSVVWAKYVDLSSWPEWNNEVGKIELDGPFAAGTTGKLFTSSGESADGMPFTLTEVVEGESFVQEAKMTEEIVMRSICQVVAGGSGSVITHKVQIDGPGSEQMGEAAGEGMKDNLARTLDALAKVVA